jgi:hypothetical protein
MAAVKEYVTTLAVLLILMAAAGALLPRGGAQNAARLAMCAALMFIMVSPVKEALAFISGSRAVYIPSVLNAYPHPEDETARDAVLAEYKAELRGSLKTLLESAGGFKLAEAEFEVDGTDASFGKITGVRFAVSKIENEEKRGIIRIEKPKITIDPFGGTKSEDGGDEAIMSLKSSVSGFYQIPPENIVVKTLD